MDTRESASSGISIGSAVFAQYTVVTDTQTYTHKVRDHAAYDIRSTSPHLCIECMRYRQTTTTIHRYYYSPDTVTLGGITMHVQLIPYSDVHTALDGVRMRLMRCDAMLGGCSL